MELVKWAQHSAPLHRHDMAAALTMVGTPIRAERVRVLLEFLGRSVEMEIPTARVLPSSG